MKNRNLPSLFVVLTTAAFASYSQAQPSTFTNVSAAIAPGLPAINDSSIAWVDYDNDGHLDFLLTGFQTQYLTELWRNTGSGFTNVPIPDLPGVNKSDVAWADFDRDGWLDFLLTGFNGEYITELWRNTGNGFTNIPVPGLTGINNGAVAWGDYDNDGLTDFLISGHAGNSVLLSQLWRNTGDGFTNVPFADLPSVNGSSVTWADYNRDGLLDFMLTGYNGDYVSQLWKNTGHGFTNVPIQGLPGVYAGSVAWADFDNDGDSDFLLSGYAGNFTLVSQLWRNTGSTFTNVPIPGLPGAYDGAVAWVDYDNDGLSDFLLTGSTNVTPSAPIAQLWRNTGTGFTNVAIPNLQGGFQGSVAWADYDNDGRSDFILTGVGATSRATQIWRNVGPATNSLPSTPLGLSTLITNGWTQLEWQPASDVQTPSEGLGYNVRVGTVPGGTDIVSPQSRMSGFRSVPGMGNAEMNTGALLNLSPGTYYWSVQAIDGALAGGAFSPEEILVVPGPELSIARFNNFVIILWSPDYPGFVLQESTSLSPETWTNSPSGGTNPAIIAAPQTLRYYRLKSFDNP